MPFLVVGTVNLSAAHIIGALDPGQRRQLFEVLDPIAQAQLTHHWRFWARPNQRLPEGNWVYWLLLAGRGFGKTRVGSETVREWVKTNDMVNLIGPTADDARDIMIKGESGILAICPDDERPVYKPSERRLEWPNGAVSLIFTADEPDRLRGKQHKKLWADELAAWRYADAWDQAMFGLRLGEKPQAVITTTPKPKALITNLVKDPKTVVTRGSSFENRENLAANFFEEIVSKYEGTRLGRQELYAEILGDTPGALWTRETIQHLPLSAAPQMRRVVVGLDPPASSQERSNEAGIVAVGLGTDDRIYVLEDGSGIMTPQEWAAKSVSLLKRYGGHQARPGNGQMIPQQVGSIVAEINQGGEMVTSVIKAVDNNVPVITVRAQKGKYLRAEPVSALYEQRKVIHCGMFEMLEDQMCTFTTDLDRKQEGSPDRLDALVWAITDLVPSVTVKPVQIKQRKMVVR